MLSLELCLIPRWACVSSYALFSLMYVDISLINLNGHGGLSTSCWMWIHTIICFIVCRFLISLLPIPPAFMHLSCSGSWLTLFFWQLQIVSCPNWPTCHSSTSQGYHPCPTWLCCSLGMVLFFQFFLLLSHLKLPDAEYQQVLLHARSTPTHAHNPYLNIQWRIPHFDFSCKFQPH